ncbi:MAG: Crp/Fnr family transcriptional regulator [Litorimonas sp.]
MDHLKLQFQAMLPPALRHRPWVHAVSLQMDRLDPQEDLLRADGSTTRIYFVVKGWLQGSTALSGKARPIANLHMRGDVIGLSWIDHPNHIEDVGAVTPTELISMPATDLRTQMNSDPYLRDYVRSELVRELMNLRMMNAVIGHMKAPDRLAYFLLVVLLRSRRTLRSGTRTLPLPLTQSQIGRILGLTNVSVNRAFRTLETDELVQAGRQSVTYLDEDALARRFELDRRVDLTRQLIGPSLYATAAE